MNYFKLGVEKKMKYKPGGQQIFLEPVDLGERPWCKEELLILVPGKYML